MMIREAIKDDCIKLAALSIKVWLDTYAKEGIKREYAEFALSNFTEAYFINLLKTPRFHLLIKEENEVVQGYVLINLESHYQSPESGFEIEKLYIDTCFQGQGLGRMLLNEVEIKFGKTYWLYTWVENESNRFYEYLGLKRVGILSFDFAGNRIENNVYISEGGNTGS